MDEFPGLLARDFGLRPRGKAAPMAARSGSGAPTSPLPADFFGAGLFAGQQSGHRPDAFFGGGGDVGFLSSAPVYDKPVYDDDGDIFGGLPGTRRNKKKGPPAAADLLVDLGGNRKSGAAHRHYDGDLLGSLGGASNRPSPSYNDDNLLSNLARGKGPGGGKRSGGSFEQFPPSYKDDLLGGLGGVSKCSGGEKRLEEQDGGSGFDDLIPGFGGSGAHKQKREPFEKNHQQSSVSSSKSTAAGAEDPYVVLKTTSTTTYSSSGLFTDPLEHIKPSSSLKSDVSSAKYRRAFVDINGFDGSMKYMPSFSFDMENINKDRNPQETVGNKPAEVSSAKASDNILTRTVPVDKDQYLYQTLLGKSSKISESYKTVNRNGSPAEDTNANTYETSAKIKASQRPKENFAISDGVWLAVSEIHLFTQPTSAPPPSRPPPSPSLRTKSPFANTDEISSLDSNARTKSDESASRQRSYLFPKSHNDILKTSTISSIDEHKDFTMGKPQANAYDMPPGEEEVDTTAAAATSAAAMKKAMDRAEAKFQLWERERDLRSLKNRETAHQVRDEAEKEKGRLDYEREQREKEEKEKERRRLEKLREMELEREREKEKARQAVERANREARERAAAEVRQKAERAARERAERAAVQRAQAEARERAATEAKERAEKLAAERERAEAETRGRAAEEDRTARERAAREKAAAEAREKAERVAVERAAAEVRARAQRAAVERAAAEARARVATEARERAAAMAREKPQQKSENDLDSFFGARASSAPRERSNSYESAFDTQFQNNRKPAGTQKTSGSSSSMKRPSSTMNIMDDLTSVFRTSLSEEFQAVEGEPEERRKSRLEREQRTRDRAAKALAEKNERELQMQREQAERDRVADSLNTEIRRWAAGKEGNLRALLSSLQYVLWPGSGWQPVSLTDLITAASVKKVYRKATLCVHPDKVRSGSVQQKYISEKVFDLLKEAWNKFNSEELF